MAAFVLFLYAVMTIPMLFHRAIDLNDFCMGTVIILSVLMISRYIEYIDKGNDQ